MAAESNRTSLRRLAWAGVLSLAVLLAVPAMASAAAYGADTYGGGNFGIGVIPPPVQPAATNVSSGGGGVISGPLSVGYVAPVPAKTIVATSSPSLPAPPNAKTSATASKPSFQFVRSLRFRDRHPDVKELQIFLNAHGATITATGAGSPGRETEYFGALTFQALVRFQNAHLKEILKPAGLTSGTGYFGSVTRAFVNTMSR